MWQKKSQHSVVFFFPTIYLVILKLYAIFEDSGSHRSRERSNNDTHMY